jgi:hypothetical protein
VNKLTPEIAVTATQQLANRVRMTFSPEYRPGTTERSSIMFLFSLQICLAAQMIAAGSSKVTAAAWLLAQSPADRHAGAQSPARAERDLI